MVYCQVWDILFPILAKSKESGFIDFKKKSHAVIFIICIIALKNNFIYFSIVLASILLMIPTGLTFIVAHIDIS